MNSLKRMIFFAIKMLFGILAAFLAICSVAQFTSSEEDKIFTGIFFAAFALIPASVSIWAHRKHKALVSKGGEEPQPQPAQVRNTTHKPLKDYEIPAQMLPVIGKAATDPIEGYTLKYHYEDVEITSWDRIPPGVKIGNRVVFVQEPTNPADDHAVRLMFVPQKCKFGYLYRGEIQDMVNDYINRGDKVVGRLSYLTFKPHKIVKIDIAFFKKNKK